MKKEIYTESENRRKRKEDNNKNRGRKIRNKFTLCIQRPQINLIAQ